MPRNKKPARKVVHMEERLDEDSVGGQSLPPEREPSPGDPSSPSPSPTQKQHKKKQKMAPLLLTEEQEEGLADWLKSNDFLYMKGKREYKDTQKKKSLWEKKALELAVDTKSLITWYDSVRTRLGKLTSQPSGSSSRVMTDRDKFILRNFEFLKSQIARKPSRLAVSMKTKAQATVTAREAQETALPSDSCPEEIIEDVEPDPQPGTLQAEGPAILAQGSIRPSKQSKGKSGRRQDPPKDTETVMATLTDQQLENTRLQMHIRSLLTPAQVSAPQLWGSWLGTMAESVHPSLMDRFYQETFQLVQRYSRESAQLRMPQDPQPQPLQPPCQGFQPIPQLSQPATHDMDQCQNRQSEMPNYYTQPRDDTRNPTTSKTQRSQSADPNIWNTPTAGFVEARPVSTPPSYDIMATGLQMSELSCLMDTSQT